MNEAISISDLEDIEIDGIDYRDYPDFCDAFISYAVWKETGIPLADDELDRIDRSDAYMVIYERACN